MQLAPQTCVARVSDRDTLRRLFCVGLEFDIYNGSGEFFGRLGRDHSRLVCLTTVLQTLGSTENVCLLTLLSF